MRRRLRRLFRRRLGRTMHVAVLAALVVSMFSLTPTRLLAAPDLAASTDQLPTGSQEWEMHSGGTIRSLRLYVPESLDRAQPAPLVVMIHGGFGSARQAERAYGWNDMAEAGRFIVAYPDGLGRAWNGGGGCCGNSGKTGVDDVGFIVAMIDLIATRIPIDQNRVYATGMSNGGIMSYRLACETDRFAAIAPVAGTLLVDCPSPAPVSILAIHGREDDSVRYDGERGRGVANIDGPPIPDLIASWREIDDCAEPYEATLGDVTDSYASCADGRVVELLSIANMGHTWPGGGSGPIGELRSLRRGGDDLVATVAIWDFFALHPKPQVNQ